MRNDEARNHTDCGEILEPCLKNLVNGISGADAQKDAALPPGGVPKDPREASIAVKATPLDRNGERGKRVWG